MLESIINKDHPFYSPMALYFIIDKNFEKDTSKVIYFFDKILKNSSIDEEKLIAEYFLSKNQNVKAEEYLQLLKNKTKK